MTRSRGLNYPLIPPLPEVAGQEGAPNWRDLIVRVDGDSWPQTLRPVDGALRVPTRDAFEALSHRDNVPGALGVRELKFFVVGVGTAEPRLYFINSNEHTLHYLFAREVLGVRLGVAEFNRVTYFAEDRQFLSGSVIAHDTYRDAGGVGLYAFAYWPSDIVRFGNVRLTHDLLRAAMPFAAERLAYHPGGEGQRELAVAEAASFDAADLPVVTSDQIFANVRYAPMNLGRTFGRLMVVDGTSERRPGPMDIPIFRQLPNDLARVAGVLTETPQTPLAHVNLRAQQNNIPNAYLRGASSDATLAPFIGRDVMLEVGPDTIAVREASAAEIAEHHAGLRPARMQVPVRDLNVGQIAPLSDIGHADHPAYGAKAANVAELRRVLAPAFVPDGFAVPYAFYDRFMSEGGFCEAFREMRAASAFQQDREVRREALSDFRKAIRAGDMPPDLRAALGQMQASFPPGTTPRCRSSANAEDMEGFSGAGLYNSYTHREDEGHIEKSIKQVWASLWTFRAFEEREFWRIDHLACAMGVLVHPNFDDERANGVAVTHNPYFANFDGYYINVQLGEDRVTNPVEDAVAEELLVMSNAGLQTVHPFVTMRLRESNLTDGGAPVMTVADVAILVAQLERVQAHFARLYGAGRDDDFAMEVEFKVDSEGQVVLKQARPWVV